jgi:hypothetical protein
MTTEMIIVSEKGYKLETGPVLQILVRQYQEQLSYKYIKH